MPLVLPNLDDKTFADLVQEARASLPALYPSWTDHNPSDPGITLIELFAWLTEMVIYRNNRITESTYRTFLKLLVHPSALPALTGQPLDDAIRSTVLGLRQIYRAASTEDYEALTIQQWPGSPEAQSTPAIRRVLCVGERNLGAVAATEVNATTAFSAIATRADGSMEDVTATASWSSSSTAIASAAAGVATGHAAGAAQITASLGAVSGHASLTVGAGTLVSIALTPARPLAAFGRLVSFVATGTYSDGARADVTPNVTWSSSAPSVLAIDASGRGRALSAGSSVVAAQLGGVTGSTSVTVSSAALASISVTPATSELAIGRQQQHVAVGHYADGTIADLTESVTWSSTASMVAFVASAPAGLATAGTGGTATLTAALGAVSGTASITVAAAALVSIAVSPASLSLPATMTIALTALGTYSDGSTADLTANVLWSSSAPSFASISNSAGSSGVATAVSTGTATFTATLGAKSGAASITVTSATLTAIAITPSSPSVPASVRLPLAAHGTYSDGSIVDVTKLVAWNTLNASVASITTDGVVTGVGAGSTGVHAALGAVTGSTTLTVTAATLSSITVTPSSAVVPLARARQMTAMGTYSNGSTFDITTLVSWSTGTTAVATVSNTDGSRGLLTATGLGLTTAVAARGAITGSTTVTVSSIPAVPASPVATIAVIPKGTPPRAPGHVTLIVAPAQGHGAAPWLTPSTALRDALAKFFAPRRLLTTHLHVVGPSYVPVTIAATIYLTGDADPGAVDARARAALSTRFDPWRGGADGEGWPFGRSLHVSEVYAQLAELSGVQRVDGVVVRGGAPPSDAEHVVLSPHQLLEVRRDALLFTLMQPRADQWEEVSP
ncbi:hypothetical protein A7982_13680 [Minicystis rosea]|nr:hypothetical protein A7982_13680 [Minicystis rosea]